MSVEEESKLLSKAAGHIRGMALMGLDTGMRRGEITSQLWEDIDLGRKLLFVTHSKTPAALLTKSDHFRSSFVRPSRSAEAAAASPTTAMN